MKAIFTSTGPTLDSPVDGRFGRCAWFVLADTDTLQFEAFENAAAAGSSGAGSQAAQFVIDRGAAAVATGNVGPNAFAVLNAAGIAVHTGAAGTVRDALAALKSGSLARAAAPTGPARHGGRQ